MVNPTETYNEDLIDHFNELHRQINERANPLNDWERFRDHPSVLEELKYKITEPFKHDGSKCSWCKNWKGNPRPAPEPEPQPEVEEDE